MPDRMDYREAILSSADTILGFARGRHMERNPKIAEAMNSPERAIAVCRADGRGHAAIQAVVSATSQLRRTIGDTVIRPAWD